MDIKSIGIIGHLGMVGGVIYRYYKEKGYVVYGYDIRQPEDKDRAYGADLIFVCVPTPFDWTKKKHDGSIVDGVMSEIPDKKVVVLKSTVPIGTTNNLQNIYPNIKILFNPEFLSERTCDNDFRNPDRQFIGFTDKSIDVAKKILSILPLSQCSRVMPAKEAELLKYINNMHGAISVMESNHYFEVCQKEGLDYERVIKAACASKYMNSYYHKIMDNGYRGFGGKCFPKDINTWVGYLEDTNIDSLLFKAVRDMNRRILKEQGLNEKIVEKK